MEKISAGAPFLDRFLEGGYECGVLTTLYGPPGSGKTNLCLLAAVHSAQQGKKVIFIDTEWGIAVERIQQICPNYLQILEKIFFFSPETFDQQREIFSTMHKVVNGQTGLMVIDSISTLYRLELGKNRKKEENGEMYETHSAMGSQIALLLEIARKKSIPILCTTQIYHTFNHPQQVRIIGGEVLKYGSKCMLELVKRSDYSSIIVRKHRSLREGKECMFLVVREGIREV